MFKAHVTRDSVAAADDMDPPHAKTVRVSDASSVETIVLAVIGSYSLPRISGGRATWCLSSSVPLAVVAQEWDEPRFLPRLPRLAEADGAAPARLELHFSYFAQMDPEVVFDVLRRLRLPPYL